PTTRFAEAKCSGCHTTGFEFYEDPAANHWKARGNGELGISCERCHGRNTNKTSSDLAFLQGFRPGDVDMTTRVRFWDYSATANQDENKYFYRNDWAKRNRQQWQPRASTSTKQR